MLRDALYLARKDLFYLLRRRETLMWTFGMPIVFFYFIGTITGGMSGGAQKETIALRAPDDAGFLVDQLVRRLEDRDYRVVRASSDEELARHDRRLTVPAGFTQSVLAHKPVQLRFERKGGGMNADYDEIRVSRAAYSLLADLIVTSSKGQDVRPEAFADLAARPRAITLSVERAGKIKNIPSGFEQAIPGTMVMFTILVLFTSGAGAVVLGKWGARMGLGAIQIAFAIDRHRTL